MSLSPWAWGSERDMNGRYPSSTCSTAKLIKSELALFWRTLFP